MDAKLVCTETGTLNFSTNDADALALFYNEFDKIIVVCILPIIAAFGVGTNLSFIFVVARVARMRTMTNLYLVQLAVADLLFLLLTLSETLIYYGASPLRLDMTVTGFVGSVTFYSLRGTVHAASMMLVTVVALEKYYAIYRPLHYQAHWCPGNRKRAIKMSVGVWVLSVVAVGIVGPWLSEYVLTCITWPEHKSEFKIVPNHVYTLNVDTSSMTAFELLTDPHSDPLWYTITFLAVALVNAVLFARIVRALNVRVVPFRPENAMLEARILRTRNQVAWMLVINGAVFFVLLAPRKIFAFVCAITLMSNRRLLGHVERGYILNVFRIMTYLNSVVNPIVYSAVSPRYRTAFRRAFKLKYKIRSF
ncbi:thyrotropin-releasing hormone receptor-like [Asterias amurensis]|uniref:thyrotropin-releasing hormone receptor-like n=1 Tax=Asterias amurensis TaxID=7602 RepID=UPI003AB12B07